MARVRVIPVLLLHDGGLIKSVKFKNYRYTGDPINTVKIFNEKEVDEIVILDIDASRKKKPPNFSQIEEKMREIVDRDVPFEREVWKREEALEFFKKQGEKNEKFGN